MSKFFSFPKNQLLSLSFIVLGALFFQTAANAQLGINAGYLRFGADEWIAGINENTGETFDDLGGYQIGIDYRIRTKGIRIELLPTASYSSLSQTSNGNDLTTRLLGFHLNTNIYLFDLEGDCDCPTWSKSGNVFQKGFFLQVAPGISHFDVKVDDENKIDGGSKGFFNVGIGAGVDIGVSKYITITPSVRYHFAPETEWTLEQAQTEERPVFNAFPKQLYAGVRLSFNFKK